MHELGIMIEIVKTVEEVARANRVTRVDALVLQIGRQAPVVPAYIRSCFPAAVDGTLLADARLEIEMQEGREFLIKEILAG